MRVLSRGALETSLAGSTYPPVPHSELHTIILYSSKSKQASQYSFAVHGGLWIDPCNQVVTELMLTDLLAVTVCLVAIGEM